ncbi:MAG TPA: hypothetical protein VJ482_04065, partial [Acidimicrobiia bacterium]|nr:hypothetical protein [Acidimicrobiia bacterium]
RRPRPSILNVGRKQLSYMPVYVGFRRLRFDQAAPLGRGAESACLPRRGWTVFGRRDSDTRIGALAW